MAIGGAVVAAVGVVVSYQQNKKAQEATAKYRKQQDEKANAIAREQGIKERRETARAARIRRAQVINAAAQTGGLNTSSRYSAISNINSQEKENTEKSFANQALNMQSSDLLSRAEGYRNNAALAEGLGAIGASYAKSFA